MDVRSKHPMNRRKFMELMGGLLVAPFVVAWSIMSRKKRLGQDWKVIHANSSPEPDAIEFEDFSSFAKVFRTETM